MKNSAQECNNQPYCLFTHQRINLLYITLIQQHLEDRQLLCMHSTKVVAACIIKELQAAGLFLALDGTSMLTDPSTSGRKYRKLVNNANFICNESIFVASAATTSVKAHAAVAMQHMPCGLSNTDYRIWENISHVALREIPLACILGI